MLKFSIAFLFLCGCAPLTSPEGTGLGTWTEPESVPEAPSALQDYLEARGRFGTGPRPDFVAVIPFVVKITTSKVTFQLEPGPC